MMANVMAVFSGTRLLDRVFDRALEEARRTGGTLVLLDVRHLRQAEHLERFLARESPLGAGTVADLATEVKRQRDHAIDRALADFEQRAAGAHVPVVRRQGKGEWRKVVAEAAEATGARVAVTAADPDLPDPPGLQMIRV